MRPAAFLPASSDSFTDAIRSLSLSYGFSPGRGSSLECVNCHAQVLMANAEPNVIGISEFSWKIETVSR